MHMYLFSKNNANAKVNQIQTNPNFLVGGSNKVSKTSNPKIIPNVAPKLQKMMECHSNAICIQKMVNAAAVIPKKQNSLNKVHLNLDIRNLDIVNFMI